MSTDIRTTCPRDCYDGCGALVRVQDGRIVHVRGDPDHPVSRGKLCRKCTLAYNGAFIDPQRRLTAPLIASGPKGSGRFREASWDEALGLCGQALAGVAAQDPARTIYSHYTGSFALLSFFFPMRLMRALGATEVAPDTICNDAGHTALGYVFGDSLEGFDPRTAADSACILIWGANPSASAPHQHSQWLPESGAKVVVVDPVRTASAEAADVHLQPFPGTDAALAFGLIHILARDQRLDQGFIDDHVLGAEDLLEVARACDPEWTAATTGVAVADLESAAQLYGAGPSLLWIGQGLQRQPNGGNIVRSVAALPALTGNVGRPGTGFLYLNGFGNRGIDEDYLAGADAYPDAPEPISHMQLTDTLEDPGRSGAFVCWNVNPLGSNPEQTRLRAALDREDLFTIACDLFATDTCDHADVVLPAASWLECDDIVVPYFHRALAAQVQTVAPLGGALSNSEMFRRLAGAIAGLEADRHPALYESDAAVLAEVLKRSHTALSFAELATAGTVWPSPVPVPQFTHDGALSFPTPSGRIELASAAAEADGHGRLARPAADARPAPGRLRLLSPASPWALNTSFGNDTKVGRRAGTLSLSLAAPDAAAAKLSHGQLARVTSEAGSLVLPVQISDALPVGVALIPKGGWPKLTGGANVNVLTTARPSDMGQSTAIHGLEVTVTAAV